MSIDGTVNNLTASSISNIPSLDSVDIVGSKPAGYVAPVIPFTLSTTYAEKKETYQLRSRSDAAYFFFGDAILPGLAVGLTSFVALGRDIPVADSLFATALVSTAAIAAFAYDNMRTIFYQSSNSFCIASECREQLGLTSPGASKDDKRVA